MSSPLTVLLLAMSVNAALRCTTHADCSFNGLCQDHACACQTAWTGDACETLRLIRSSPELGYHAVTQDGNRTASWGGSVVRGDDGQWHMYAAEIVGGCGMNVWLSNSRVVHASSPDPTTKPFVRQGVVASVFAHEPIAQRAPTGEYVVWFTAVLPPALPPVNGGQRCTGCADGRSPERCGTDANRNASTPLPTYMVHSSSPSGPWSEPELIPGTAVFADSNFAPVIKSDGSVVGLTRGDVIAASHWSDVSSYRVVGQWHDLGEDPYVWLDQAGVFHNIVHMGPRDQTYGKHYWSLDGVGWTPSGGSGVAYNNTLEYSDGRSVHLGCRERPHIVQDEQLRLIGLSNGAAPITCHSAGDDDYSFTSLQLVSQEASD